MYASFVALKMTNKKPKPILMSNVIYFQFKFTFENFHEIDWRINCFAPFPVDKAKVVFAPPEVYLPYGRPATLDCHFRSNPPLTNLRWEKDGFLFDPYNVQVNLSELLFHLSCLLFFFSSSLFSFIVRESSTVETAVFSSIQSMNRMPVDIRVRHTMILARKDHRRWFGKYQFDDHRTSANDEMIFFV